MATSYREPLPRSSHAAVGIGSKLYVWGGFSVEESIRTTELEVFDVPSVTWEEHSQVLRGSDMPDDIYDMAVTSNGETAYCYGGRTGTSSANRVFHNTLFQVTPSQDLCQELQPTNAASEMVPGKTCNSRMVHFENMLVLHGGIASEGDDRWPASNELHVFDLRNRVWAVQPTTGEKPPLLSSHTFTKIDRHRAVMFGGRAESGVTNDTFVLDLETWHWTRLQISGNKPPARDDHATCCVAGPLTGQQSPLVMVMGGYHGKNEVLSDVWLLDVDKGVWNEVTLPAAITSRHCHSAVVFGSEPNFRVVVLFGGDWSDWTGDTLSETTLMLLELRGGSCQVTRVVKPDELEKPDKKLSEQMKKLKLPPYEELQTKSTATEGAASPTPHKDTSSLTHSNGAVARRGTIIDIKEVHVSKHIGQGGFGAVFEAKWKKKRVAVKVCPGNLIENLSREIEVLTSLPPHPNVLTFFGVALGSDGISTLIITELASNGSLHDYLHVKKERPSLDQSIGWAQQIAHGMQHLHSNNIVHRDLKSGNILLASGLLAKVGDFGTARTLAKTAKTTQKGTYRWMAPEIVKGVEANINKMCDVFSYGMVLYEIFAHEIPYDDIPTDPLVGMAVLQGKRPPVPATLPLFLQPLLEACWKEEPKQRPQFEAIIEALQTESYE